MAASRFPDASPMHYFPAAVLCESLQASTSPPRDRQQTSWTGKHAWVMCLLSYLGQPSIAFSLLMT